MTTPTTPRVQAGRPVWIDLATHDVEAAKAFYGELFGWTFSDQGEDFAHYHLIEKDGAQLGGVMSSLMSCEGPTSEPTSPTAWTVYLHSEDVAATVEKLDECGAQLLFGPMDVADHGRQAFVVDPAGAHLGLWQPNQMGGFEPSTAPGTPVWFEAMSADLDAALPFYRDLLDWDISWMEGSEDGSEGGFRYLTNGAGDDAAAGLCDASTFLPEGTTSYWRVHFEVADVDAAVEDIRRLGGQVESEPEDCPFGRFAQARDPQGALFMVHEEPGAGASS